MIWSLQYCITGPAQLHAKPFHTDDGNLVYFGVEIIYYYSLSFATTYVLPVWASESILCMLCDIVESVVIPLSV